MFLRTRKRVRSFYAALGRNTGKVIEAGNNKIAEEKISYVKFGDHATNLPATVRFAINGVFRESMQYKYDSMGNIVEISGNGRMIYRYEYDALGRLTREDNVPFNRTTTWAYGRQLVSYDGNTFAYDARGRRTAKNNITFIYDSNESLKATDPLRWVQSMNNIAQRANEIVRDELYFA